MKERDEREVETERCTGGPCCVRVGGESCAVATGDGEEEEEEV